MDPGSPLASLEPVLCAKAFVHNIQGCGDSRALIFTLELSDFRVEWSGCRVAADQLFSKRIAHLTV